tara:strand:+ start:3604 stop:3735 length:132 start_codon:yes stop_codon:yes gene_type:complete
MKIPDYTLAALELIGQKLPSEILRSIIITLVWIGLGIFIGINI